MARNHDWMGVDTSIPQIRARIPTEQVASVHFRVGFVIFSVSWVYE